MKSVDFSSNSPGRLVPTTNGLSAFVPDALPPDIQLENLFEELQAAALAIGELKGAIRPLPNPELVIQPMQYREALSSSSMEGTYTTFTDLLVFDAGGAASPRTDTKEVHNYLQSLRRSDELLQDLPVCVRLIRELHAQLLASLDLRSR
jgi:Fic family protein